MWTYIFLSSGCQSMSDTIFMIRPFVLIYFPILSWNRKLCTEPNTPPLATHQSLKTYEDIAINILLTGTDAENNALSFEITGWPSNGTVSGSGANWTYTLARNGMGRMN